MHALRFRVEDGPLEMVPGIAHGADRVVVEVRGTMALEDSTRPQVRYARESVGVQTSEALAKALELARRVEELLEETRADAPSLPPGALMSNGAEESRAHATRMARAMAASLVDELESLVRPSRHSGVA